MKESDNIFIRNLSAFDQSSLIELKELFKEKTNTQATLKAIRGYAKLKAEAESLEKEKKELEEELKNLKGKLQNLKSSFEDIISIIE